MKTNSIQIDETVVKAEQGSLVKSDTGRVSIVAEIQDSGDSDTENNKYTFIDLSTGESYFNLKGCVKLEKDKNGRSSIKLPYGWKVITDDVIITPEFKQ